MHNKHYKTIARLTLLLAVAFTVPVQRAEAQTPAVASPSEAARTVADPNPDADAFRLQELSELQARDAVLTRRVRAFGVSLGVSSLIMSVGTVMAVRNVDVCIFGCGNTPGEDRRLAAGGMLLLSGMAGGLASTVGLIVSGTRRRRGRSRIDELRLTPIAAIGHGGTTGGVSLHLTW